MSQDPTTTTTNFSGLVNVPDPNGTGLVAVALSTQHILSNAEKYSLKDADFANTQEIAKKLRAIMDFFKSQESVVGDDGVANVSKHFCKSILKGTPYEKIFAYFWRKADGSWSAFLEKLGEAIGIPQDNRLCDLAIALQSYTPAQGLNLRSAVMDYAGKIQHLADLNTGFVPHQQ